MTRPSLADLELDARSHFAIRLHAAVLLVVDHLRRVGRRTELSAVLSRHQFLGGYLDAAMPFLPPELSWEEIHAWWAAAIAEWTDERRRSLPICRLEDGLDLDGLACSQLLVAGLVDEDSRFGQVFAELNGQ